MNTYAPSAPPPALEPSLRETPNRSTGAVVLILLASVGVVGVALRFATLGLQSFHHDEVITVMRVIPGSFTDMLHRVQTSESNPPLYYVLAWGWAKAFGSGEVGIRSLSALLGSATIPVGYLIGCQLLDRRAGLILAALVAVNPMLIWYSQEARSYALLVLCCALSFLFFVRALDSRRGRDLGLWALASALALWSHYFAFFLVGIEGLWLLAALWGRWRPLLPALAAAAAAGLALLPLFAAQVNPEHIGWIETSPLPERLVQGGVSFLSGETGHVIAEPPRGHFALVPAILVGLGLLLVLLHGDWRERRRAALGTALGVGVVALAVLAALLGKDYVIERNLLPALVPLGAAVAVGFSVRRHRCLGALLAVALCAYWIAFDVHVTRTPNLQRPDFKGLAQELGPPSGRRAIVMWRLAADPARWYLHDHSLRWYGGPERVTEVDIVGKSIAAVSRPLGAGRPGNLPASFHQVGRVRLKRLTLTRYASKHPVKIWNHTLRDLPIGFGRVGVLLDGPPAQRPQAQRSSAPPGPGVGLAPNRVAPR
ncbi:MAG TPA: glycosyltransferase family 39 protein [Solirubrobacterales bacterium]|nr:glycosyltransferase family 39 protein [Solirubrobacterales bacterium]